MNGNTTEALAAQPNQRNAAVPQYDFLGVIPTEIVAEVYGKNELGKRVLLEAGDTNGYQVFRNGNTGHFMSKAAVLAIWQAQLTEQSTPEPNAPKPTVVKQRSATPPSSQEPIGDAVHNAQQTLSEPSVEANKPQQPSFKLLAMYKWSLPEEEYLAFVLLSPEQQQAAYTTWIEDEIETVTMGQFEEYVEYTNELSDQEYDEFMSLPRIQQLEWVVHYNLFYGPTTANVPNTVQQTDATVAIPTKAPPIRPPKPTKQSLLPVAVPNFTNPQASNLSTATAPKTPKTPTMSWPATRPFPVKPLAAPLAPSLAPPSHITLHTLFAPAPNILPAVTPQQKSRRIKNAWQSMKATISNISTPNARPTDALTRREPLSRRKKIGLAVGGAALTAVVVYVAHSRGIDFGGLFGKQRTLDSLDDAIKITPPKTGATQTLPEVITQTLPGSGTQGGAEAAGTQLQALKESLGITPGSIAKAQRLAHNSEFTWSVANALSPGKATQAMEVGVNKYNTLNGTDFSLQLKDGVMQIVNGSGRSVNTSEMNFISQLTINELS